MSSDHARRGYWDGLSVLAHRVVQRVGGLVHIRSQVDVVDTWHDDELVEVTVPVAELLRQDCDCDRLRLTRCLLYTSDAAD